MNPATSCIVVGIAECAVSADPAAVLATYALGSCIGLAVWDPLAKVGGLLHFMLPESSLDAVRGRENPYLYADTGVAALIEACSRLGAKPGRLITRAAGAAQVLDTTGVFSIGARNHSSLRSVLHRAGVGLHAEALGGSVSRSVRLEVGTGRFWVREGAGSGQELPFRRNSPAASLEVGRPA